VGVLVGHCLDCGVGGAGGGGGGGVGMVVGIGISRDGISKWAQEDGGGGECNMMEKEKGKSRRGNY
jgi:hypothetical protein